MSEWSPCPDSSKGQPHTRAQTTEPLVIIWPHVPSLCAVHVRWPIPANAKEVRVSPFSFLSNPGDSPLCFLPPPESTSNGFHMALPRSPPLIPLHATSCKAAIFWTIVLIHWDSASPQQFGSNKLLRNFFLGWTFFCRHQDNLLVFFRWSV